MLQFSCRFALLSTFRLSNRSPKITRILTLYQAKRDNFDEVQFFKDIPKLIIFGIHLNIIHSSTNYCSCSFTYLLFILNCITRSDENYASHCTELSQLHQQPVDAVLRPSFIRKLCCNLYIHTDF